MEVHSLLGGGTFNWVIVGMVLGKLVVRIVGVYRSCLGDHIGCKCVLECVQLSRRSHPTSWMGWDDHIHVIR